MKLKGFILVVGLVLASFAGGVFGSLVLNKPVHAQDGAYSVTPYRLIVNGTEVKSDGDKVFINTQGLSGSVSGNVITLTQAMPNR